jgi:hypothetical protein
MHHIAVSNSPTFPCWTDAYIFRYYCLTLVQAKQHMRHTVSQTNWLMHVPSVCMMFNTPSLEHDTHIAGSESFLYQMHDHETSQ